MDKFKKKKVLFVHHARGMGGAPTSMLNIIRNLDKEKFALKVLFIFENPSICGICDEEKIDYRILKGFFFRRIYNINVFSEVRERNLGYNLRIYPIIRDVISWVLVGCYFSKKILKQEKADIIHFNTTFLTDWLWGIRKLDCKKIVHVREPFAKRGLGLRRYFFRNILKRNADQIFAISEDNRNRLNIPEKTQVVYNFMEVPSAFKKKINTEEISVLYLGGDSKVKGYEILKEAAKHLHPNISITIAGNVSEENKANSCSNLIYIGIIKDVYFYLNKADILIFPSIYPHFAKPVIEAGMCKVPVIASNIEGMNEILKNEENGLLVEPHNSYALAEAINYLASNPELRKEMGDNNLKLVKSKFSIEANYPIIENAYLK